MNKMMIKQGIIIMDMQYAHGWIWSGGVEKLRKSVLFFLILWPELYSDCYAALLHICMLLQL